ncbi:MAG: MlaD family protein [Bacteroidota bacterium]
MKIKREIKIGVVATLSLLLFLWGLNYLKGEDIFSKQIVYYAVYDDVTGLIESNPVSLNGVNIGQVKTISFMPDQSGRILVENIIRKDIMIPDDSYSVITGMSLTGTREIVIELGNSTTYLQNGDTLSSRQQASIQEEVSQLVLPIQQHAENLFAQIDSVMLIFQSVFNENTRSNIVQSFESIQKTLYTVESSTVRLDNTLDEETTRIKSILTDTESITQNLSDNSELLTHVMQNFSNISDSIAAANLTQTLLRAEESLTSMNEILEKINNGQGTAGLLVNDEELYNNLSASSKQLEELLDEIKDNPGDYINLSVFGR